jgi:hypothetical protein
MHQLPFENGEFGSTWSFTTFENGTGAGYSKVSNPFPGGINNSATVGKFSRKPESGTVWWICDSPWFGSQWHCLIEASSSIVQNNGLQNRY